MILYFVRKAIDGATHSGILLWCPKTVCEKRVSKPVCASECMSNGVEPKTALVASGPDTVLIGPVQSRFFAQAVPKHYKQPDHNCVSLSMSADDWPTNTIQSSPSPQRDLNIWILVETVI